MLKHGATTRSKDADAETRSSCMVRGQMLNKSCHSVQMLRHSGDCHDAETRTPTDSSQGAIHVAETARELRC
jgi:hypothetical protein